MWKSCRLYLIFVGRHDRHGLKIADTLFDESRDAVEQLILDRLGGLTKIRVLEGWGRTLSWADEPSTLLATLTDSEHADQVLEQCANTLAHSLNQEQIWVARQRTDIFISADSSA